MTVFVTFKIGEKEAEVLFKMLVTRGGCTAYGTSKSLGTVEYHFLTEYFVPESMKKYITEYPQDPQMITSTIFDRTIDVMMEQVEENIRWDELKR